MAYKFYNRFINVLFSFCELLYNRIGDKMNKELTVVFMGTPAFAVPILEGLIENYKVIGVVSQPDKEVGRKKIVTKTPVKECAEKYNIKVLQPIKIKEDYEDIIELHPDLIVTCAYGQIIPKILLDLPKYGCINVHASLLPKLRGGAPIHKAIIDGYTKTGVTIMYMDEKMDNGDIISQQEIKIEDAFTTEILHDKLSVMGKELLLKTIPNIISGNIHPVKQNEDEVTYAWNIKREEEKIDFSKKTREVFNQIRGLNSWPGAYCYLGDKTLKLYDVAMHSYISEKKVGTIIDINQDGIVVALKDGCLIIKSLKLEGKRKMTFKEFVNGNKDLIGKVLK